MSATTIIAIYGAVLSTLVLLWNLYRDATNRGKLRVECSLEYKFITGIHDDTLYLFHKVTNIGKQPIMLTNVGGTTKNKGDSIIGHSAIPRMLHPGEYVHIETPDLSDLTMI
jgi:hypothetical protein